VELVLRLRDGRRERLRLPGVEPGEPLLTELQGLLGVLGRAELLGTAVADAGVERERELVAAAG
jgi:hypothetical protein